VNEVPLLVSVQRLLFDCTKQRHTETLGHNDYKTYNQELSPMPRSHRPRRTLSSFWIFCTSTRISTIQVNRSTNEVTRLSTGNSVTSTFVNPRFRFTVVHQPSKYFIATSCEIPKAQDNTVAFRHQLVSAHTLQLCPLRAGKHVTLQAYVGNRYY